YEHVVMNFGSTGNSALHIIFLRYVFFKLLSIKHSPVRKKQQVKKPQEKKPEVIYENRAENGAAFVKGVESKLWQKMPLRKAPRTRTTSATDTDTTTIPVTNAQVKALIDQGVADALAVRDTDRSQNGDDNHDLGTGSRRTKRTTRECTYIDYLKCQPMNFKGTEGVVGLT
nr:hypothetical protein [Tanacetum cinerariifolium]